MKKILFTTPILAYPPAGGPYLRIANTIKVLNGISELYILSRVRKNIMGGDEAYSYYSSISRFFDWTPSKRNYSTVNYFIRQLLINVNTKLWRLSDGLFGNNTLIKPAKKKKN